MNIEKFDKNLDQIGEWIKSVDQKVAIFLAFQGIILTGVLAVLFKEGVVNQFLSQRYFVFFIIVGVEILFYGIAKSIYTILPQLKNNHKKSLLYFKDISSIDIVDFKKRMEDLNEKEYRNYVLEQIHILSCIATKKHEQFRDAIIIFCSGIILLLICLFISLNYYV